MKAFRKVTKPSIFESAFRAQLQFHMKNLATRKSIKKIKYCCVLEKTSSFRPRITAGEKTLVFNTILFFGQRFPVSCQKEDVTLQDQKR